VVVQFLAGTGDFSLLEIVHPPNLLVSGYEGTFRESKAAKTLSSRSPPGVKKE
jgi:hypothetical protein